MLLLLLVACRNPAPSPPGGGDGVGYTLVEYDMGDGSADTAGSLPMARVLHEDGSVPVDGELPRVRVGYGPTAEQYVEPLVWASSPVPIVGMMVTGSSASEEQPDYLVPNPLGLALADDGQPATEGSFLVRLYTAEREPDALGRQCARRGTEATLSLQFSPLVDEPVWAPFETVTQVVLVGSEFLDELCADEGL